MEYEIQISETCLEEIEDICKYIEENLKAQNASYRLREKIRSNILRLKKSPRIYAKVGKRDRLNREYRRIVIDNFVILYTIIEEDRTVLVAHMYYGGRNYIDGGLL